MAKKEPRPIPKKKPSKLKEVEGGQDITVKFTSKEDAIDDPEVQEVLPIDELIKIATAKNMLKQPTDEERFQAFIRAIKLHDIVYDCMQSSFNEYCKAYNKTNPDDHLKIKLHISRKHAKDSAVIFAVACSLEVSRAGKFFKLFEKQIDFTHIKQIRDEVSWKYSLYGAVYNDLITHSLNYLLLQDDVKSGRIKSDVPSGDSSK